MLTFSLFALIQPEVIPQARADVADTDTDTDADSDSDSEAGTDTDSECGCATTPWNPTTGFSLAGGVLLVAGLRRALR